MKMILRLVKPYWRMLLISLSFKSVGALADLFLPWLIAYMIDTEIPRLRSEPNAELTSLYLLGGLMVIIAFLGFYLNVAANRKAEMIAAAIKKNCPFFFIRMKKHKSIYMLSSVDGELARFQKIRTPLPFSALLPCKHPASCLGLLRSRSDPISRSKVKQDKTSQSKQGLIRFKVTCLLAACLKLTSNCGELTR